MGMRDTAGCIVLIGMPGVGKSTIGVLLAKATTREFVDTDLVIQAREHKTLEEIATAHGREGFRDIEGEAIRTLYVHDAVVATGGSAIYRDAAMQHLRELGEVVFLDVSLETLERRLGDLDARGVSREPGQSLADLYEERRPLYEKYADIRVDLTGLDHDASERAVLDAID